MEAFINETSILIYKAFICYRTIIGGIIDEKENGDKESAFQSQKGKEQQVIKKEFF
jgi:hypothetical protein